jgi:hypothetical protein
VKRRVLGAMALLATLACRPAPIATHDGDAGHHAEAAPTEHAEAASPSMHDAATGTREASADATKLDESAVYASAAPESGKSIGHTSVVFKLKLVGGLQAAYKPQSKRGHDRYKGEIAAYRLGRALGLTNVPLAMPRRFDRATLERAVGSGTPAAALLAEESRADDHGTISGALIPWIANLGFSTLERTQPEWRAWLSSAGVIPDDKRALAADISTMIAFDYVTANWDRWSGGNIGLDARSGRLLFIDNDAAFFASPPASQLRGMRKDVEGVKRFSRGFVERLRGLNDERVREDVGDEEPGQPLLSASVVSGVAARAAEVVQVIDQEIAKSGEPAVLFFE